METPHRPFADRTVRSFAIATPSDALKKRAALFYKISRHILPSQLMIKLCATFYETGVFFLQLFDALLNELKLAAKQRDMLFQDASTLDISQAGNQTTESNKQFGHDLVNDKLSGVLPGDGHK